ncbi:hypothetical protein CRV24_009350 [Beauveria bassiana]|nr:hypothetical protein CRV24_009350 [Beauveria bassiana]
MARPRILHLFSSTPFSMAQRTWDWGVLNASSILSPPPQRLSGYYHFILLQYQPAMRLRQRLLLSTIDSALKHRRRRFVRRVYIFLRLLRKRTFGQCPSGTPQSTPHGTDLDTRCYPRMHIIKRSTAGSCT